MPVSITSSSRMAALVSAAVAVLAGYVPALGASDAGEDGPSRGQIVTVAGTGEAGYSGDGGDALDARLNDHPSISVGPDGSVYIADTVAGRLRKVDPDGTIDTVEGTRAPRSPETASADQLGWSVSNMPRATAVGPDGSIYVAADLGVSRIDSAGEITLIAGARGDDVNDEVVEGGPAIDARIYRPDDIAVDGAGNVYVPDPVNERIRKIDPDGIVTTVAGGGDLSLRASEGLAATGANVSAPTSVEVDSQGNVYFMVETDGSVYKVDAAGILTTVTGTAEGFGGDGGPAIEAELDGAVSIAVDAEDILYIADGNDRIRRVDPDGKITTVGPRLPGPGKIAVGPAGDLYFTSGVQVKMLVRGVDQAADDDAAEDGPGDSPWAEEDPGAVVTVAGVERAPDEELEPAADVPPDSALGPRSVAVDASGVLYYADTERHVVNEVDTDGVVSTFAGTGAAEFSGDGGPAAEAALSSPAAVSLDDAGNLYVADTGNGRIRKIATSGVISTVAGSGEPSGDGEEELPVEDGGPATEARLGHPLDVAVGADGSVFVADGDRIRKVDPAGVITTVAGGGNLLADEADNAPATEAALRRTGSVEVDAAGNVYLSEDGYPSVRMVRPDGVLVTIAGDSQLGPDEGGFAGDGGPAIDAELNKPDDVEVGPDGTVYVADTYNSRIRAIDPSGVIATIAGTGAPRDNGDDGPAAEAALDEPVALAVDANGMVYVTGPRGDAIREIGADGTITTVATTEAADERSALDAEFGRGIGIAVDSRDRLYVADSENGRLDTVVDGAISPFEPSGRSLASADVVTTTAAGDLYAVVAGEVVRVDPDGGVVTVAGGGPEDAEVEDGQDALTASFEVSDIAAGPDGALYIADSGRNRVYTLRADGTLGVLAELGESDVEAPGGMAVGPDGTVYVADPTGHRVLTLDADGDATTVAGSGADSGDVEGEDIGDDGPAVEAVVVDPTDVAVDADGNLYVNGLDGIRRVDTGGTITTVFASPAEPAGTPGSINDAPSNLAIGPHGDLYFVDTHTNQVRVIVRPGEISGPVPKAWIGAGAGAVVLAGIVVLVISRRRRRNHLATTNTGVPATTGSPQT